ncbi:dynein-related subfamily AAA family protein [Micromonospora palomenae]|uniref:Dynein-related subfamily AAA family protein n=1 Tax=Micromonospora palomenae TaxID=1461247 RepID=A0A561WWF7_9ACTN|nr:AAA family ATPase [Micromonospora palomenae]TWG28188.1 dynein-related subfamily AAA family protein [Micromonospora palomenae]
MDPATPPTTIDPTPGGPEGDRRPGYLYRQVAAYLASQPDQWLKVGQVTTAIAARSTGAVFEALKKMAAAGYASHSTGPHRFQITKAGIDAAGAMPPPAPRTPRSGRGAGRRQPVPRPNGDLYFPRKLAGATDVDVLRWLREKRIPVLLYGPPGTGKTALVEAAFPDLLTVAGTGDTVVEDFLGNFIPLPDGGFEFVYGPLVTAMREGRALLVDDATLIAPKVLAVLYPAMDGRRVITIPGYRNERVDAVDGFYVIAGHNPGVHGAILTEALASRFDVHIEVTTDWDLARHLGVPAPAVQAAIALNTDLAAGRVSWAPQLRELLGFARVRKTLGLPAAVANLAGRAPEDDREHVLAALRQHFGSEITALTLGKQR